MRRSYTFINVPQGLEELSRKDWRGRVEHDPVRFPRRYKSRADREVAALIASSLAYGRADVASRAIETVMDCLDGSPAKTIRSAGHGEIKDRLGGVKYRFSGSDDIALFLSAVGEVLRRHGSLERTFLAGFDAGEMDIRAALARFTTLLRSYAALLSRKRGLSHGFRHLVPDAGNGSPLKRLLLFLRWVVRPDDGIDLGLWSGVPPSSLVIPLDTHVFRIGGYLGLHDRRSPVWAAAREITDSLRRVDPADPLRFDFPLCHLGMSGACPVRRDPAKCAACPLRPACKACRGERKRSRISPESRGRLG
ncbi:MAG: TIGR02757 family protein [Nitrospirae bacterium RBG_16_64_22]|nr:MAG: TIGR02757 family protein [Nitrospirae bacterium RBG_16_64_22]